MKTERRGWLAAVGVVLVGFAAGLVAGGCGTSPNQDSTNPLTATVTTNGQTTTYLTGP
jgi:hypothetical protein